jgi:hypothetical protein
MARLAGPIVADRGVFAKINSIGSFENAGKIPEDQDDDEYEDDVSPDEQDLIPTDSLRKNLQTNLRLMRLSDEALFPVVGYT